jgi:hypothetical protein
MARPGLDTLPNCDVVVIPLHLADVPAPAEPAHRFFTCVTHTTKHLIRYPALRGAHDAQR